MKEGDSVFVGPGIIHWMPVDANFPTVRLRHYATTCEITEVIPDVPNLAHIARFLADHPETVDALDLVIQAANAMEEFIPASLPDRRDAPGIVSELLKAMRGEGGHE